MKKLADDWLTVNANWATLEGLVMLGDTIAIDTLGLTAFNPAQADRFFAVVNGIDTPNQRIRVVTNRTGVTFGAVSADLMFMGDAAAVSTVPDANGNAVQAYLNEINLSDGNIR